MSTLSEKATEIFGFKINEGQWKNYLKKIDVAGEPTRKNIGTLLFTLCEEVEKLSKEVESISTPRVVDSKATDTQKAYGTTSNQRRNTKNDL